MNKKTTGAGTIFIILLQLAFIILKLCNVITWRWALVLMPLIVWAGVAIILIVVFVILMLVGGVE